MEQWSCVISWEFNWFRKEYGQLTRLTILQGWLTYKAGKLWVRFKIHSWQIYGSVAMCNIMGILLVP